MTRAAQRQNPISTETAPPLSSTQMTTIARTADGGKKHAATVHVHIYITRLNASTIKPKCRQMTTMRFETENHDAGSPGGPNKSTILHKHRSNTPELASVVPPPPPPASGRGEITYMLGLCWHPCRAPERWQWKRCARPSYLGPCAPERIFSISTRSAYSRDSGGGGGTMRNGCAGKRRRRSGLRATREEQHVRMYDVSKYSCMYSRRRAVPDRWETARLTAAREFRTDEKGGEF